MARVIILSALLSGCGGFSVGSLNVHCEGRCWTPEQLEWYGYVVSEPLDLRVKPDRITKGDITSRGWASWNVGGGHRSIEVMWYPCPADSALAHELGHIVLHDMGLVLEGQNSMELFAMVVSDLERMQPDCGE